MVGCAVLLSFKQKPSQICISKHFLEGYLKRGAISLSRCLSPLRLYNRSAGGLASQGKGEVLFGGGGGDGGEERFPSGCVSG